MTEEGVEEKIEIYECRYCGKEYKSKWGVQRHEEVCSERPRVEEKSSDSKQEADVDDSEGFEIFDDLEDDEEIEYECTECGYVSGSSFEICPRCGEELEWEDDEEDWGKEEEW